MFTKKALLGSLSFATVLMLGNWSVAIAETVNVAPIFQNIKNKIPKNLGFRLPQYMPVISKEVNPVFSISDQNVATVTLEFIDGRCRSLPKDSRGYLVGCRALSISSGSTNSDFWRQKLSYRGETFLLSRGISSKHFQGDGWGMIYWVQNGKAFFVYGPDYLYLGDDCNVARGHFCDFRFGELVKIARSMAGQPVISTPVKPTDAIAKYPTNDDFDAFDTKLRGNPESLVKLRGNQSEQRRKFQNDWKDRNPNAAKFLGAWYTGDRYFYVFPSTAKGGTCVVTQDANGKLDMKIGTVLNQELRYDGGKGFSGAIAKVLLHLETQAQVVSTQSTQLLGCQNCQKA